MSFPALRSPRILNPLSFSPALTAPTVTTNAASAIGSTSATGNGSVDSDGGAAITERGFVWSTSVNPTTADSKVTVAGTTGSYSGSMTSLVASTFYHYRAYAVNSVGTSYGADTTFTTGSGTAIGLLALLGVG